MINEHAFTGEINNILMQEFGEYYAEIFKMSSLLQYLNYKTKSASSGSKARGGYANIFAIFVLVEDYVNKGFKDSNNYSKYDGANYKDLLTRQRELPFGSKLQNHALNHRLNQEFLKIFPESDIKIILRNPQTYKYWINEHFLIVKFNNQEFNISNVVLQIIYKYIQIKQDSFNLFIDTMKQIQCNLRGHEEIKNLLAPNVDARIFEIVSFSILKFYHIETILYWGYKPGELNKDNLILYKTGRTNANDGGIDFVMKPLGRFFQVTETTDVTKFFLDIDKVQKFPLTFVVKSCEDQGILISRMREKALEKYGIESIVENYMNCIEEIINVPMLLDYLDYCSYDSSLLNGIINEIILQSELEFNQ